MFVNLHSHRDLEYDSVGIINLDDFNTPLSDNSLYSVGVHPWKSIDSNSINYLNDVVQLSHNKLVVAIGECGYDNLKGDRLIQTKLFEKQVELSELVQKPLIIHSVGTHHQILADKKRYNPKQKWLMHSALVSKEMGDQFIRANIYFSFGFRSLQHLGTIDIFKRYPRNLIFFETDDSSVSINMIYNFAATILKCDVESLKEQCYSNFREFIDNG